MAGRLHVYYIEDTINKLWKIAEGLGIHNNDLAFAHLSEQSLRELLHPLYKQYEQSESGEDTLTLTISAQDFKEKFSNIRAMKMKGFYKGKDVTEEELEKGGASTQQVEQEAHD